MISLIQSVLPMKKRALVATCAVVSAALFLAPSRHVRQPASLLANFPVFHGHSHNDYEQGRPLADALDNRFYSVEADIWLVKDQVWVSHFGWFFAGTLKKLYLDPLQERVSRFGSVYGDSKPFTLWVDIKDENPELVRELHHLLSQYPMLSRFTQKQTIQNPVTVVLTGRGAQKLRYVKRYPIRYACRDSLRFEWSDPPVDNQWCWYALKWDAYFQWKGDGPMPEEQKARLTELVSAIHQKGRKLRIWGVPENPNAWQSIYSSGVDLIGTDSLQHFGESLRTLHQKDPSQNQNL